MPDTVSTNYANITRGYEYVSLAKGFPPGTFGPGSMTIEDLISEVKELAIIHDIIEWGILGSTVVFWYEFAKAVRDLRGLIGVYNFPWDHYALRGQMIGRSLDAGVYLDPRVHYDIPWEFFRPSTQTHWLTPTEQGVLYNTAVAEGWHTTVCNRAVNNLIDWKRSDVKGDMLGAAVTSARRRIEIAERHYADPGRGRTPEELAADEPST